MIEFSTRARHALVAALAAVILCATGAWASSCGVGVDVGAPGCTVLIKQAPTLGGVIGDRHVTAEVNISCIPPFPLKHHAEAWLAPNGDGSGDPRKAVWGVADFQQKDIIPDKAGITFKLYSPCKNTSPHKMTWRVDVETSGTGPASKAAPNGLPFTMKLEDRPQDMMPTDLPCKFNG